MSVCGGRQPWGPVFVFLGDGERDFQLLVFFTSSLMGDIWILDLGYAGGTALSLHKPSRAPTEDRTQGLEDPNRSQ